jgi:pimeloyl-ACP methyl ester carboxylesterase
MANVDTASKLNTIKVPTLCLAGEVDKSTPPPVVKAMADAIPGARFAMLPGAPHMPFVEMPQDVANAVMPFLKQALA